MIEAVLRRSEGRMYRGYARVFVRRHGDINDDFSTEISFIHDLVITEESIGYEDSYGQLHPVEVRSDCLFSLRQLSKQERKFLYDEAVLNAMDYRVVFYMKSIAGEARLIRQYENQYISPVLKQSSRSQYQVQLSMLFSPSEANEHFETIEPPIPPMFVYPAVNDTELLSTEVVKVRVRVQAGGRLFLGVRVHNTVSVLEEWDSIADVVNGWSVSSVGGFLEKEFEYVSSERGLRYEFFGYVRYFNQDSAQSEWLVRRRFSAPVLSGFPTSVVVPTMVSFQGLSTRGTGNELASEVEFEWLVNSVSQSNVFSFYNSSGDAQGIFTLPSNINAAGLIRVRGRSKNAQVVGEWSDYQDINITLFRPLPTILQYTANNSAIAQDANPAMQLYFTFQIQYSDNFSGACTWEIQRMDTNTVVSSGSQPNSPFTNPFTVTQQLTPLPSFTSKTTVTYRLIAKNPDNQSVHQDLNVTFVPRPPLNSDVRMMFNPAVNAFKDVSTDPNNPVPANVGDTVELLKSEHSETTTPFEVVQGNAGERPTLVLHKVGGRPVLRFTWDKFLLMPTTQTSLRTTANSRRNISVIVVTNNPQAWVFTAQAAVSLSQGNNSTMSLFSGHSSFPNTSFFIANGSTFQNFAVQNIINIFGVCVATFEANTLNGFKAYFNDNVLIGSFNGTTFDSDVHNGRLGINRSGYNNQFNGAPTRLVGHIVIFNKTLTATEIGEWVDWLKAMYDIP